MRRFVCFTFLSLIPLVSSAINSFDKQVQQAGVLSQEVGKLTRDNNRLDKPTGQLFNNPIKIHAQDKNIALRFELISVDVKELGSNGLEDSVTEDLSTLIAPYLKRRITLSDLYQLTDGITRYYRDNNFLVAKAFLPPQEVENGKLVIGVMKGKVGQITIDNQSRLRESFVRRMANTSVNSVPYLAQDEVEKLSLLLNDIRGVNSKLSIKAGSSQGETALNVALKNGKRWQAYLFSDNQGTPETGRYRLGAGVKGFNLLGFGDELDLDVLSSQNANLKNIRVDYSGLLDGYGTRLGVFASHLNYKLGKEFEALNAKGHSNSFGIYLRHPTIRTPNFNMNTQLTFTHSDTVDSQFVTRTVENISKVNKVSLGVNGVWNSLSQGTTYFNLNAAIGSEKNNSTEEAHNRPIGWKSTNKFMIFNAEVGHEQALAHSFALDLNMKAQMSDRNISSSQKMLLGGVSGVRAYRSGVVSVADGFVGQLSLKHYKPLFKDSLLTSSVFYDIGTGKKYHDIDGYSQRPEKTNKVSLQGIGFGFQLSSPNNYSVNLTYGHVIGSKLAGERKQQLAISLVKLF